MTIWNDEKIEELCSDPNPLVQKLARMLLQQREVSRALAQEVDTWSKKALKYEALLCECDGPDRCVHHDILKKLREENG